MRKQGRTLEGIMLKTGLLLFFTAMTTVMMEATIGDLFAFPMIKATCEFAFGTSAALFLAAYWRTEHPSHLSHRRPMLARLSWKHS